LVPYPHPLIAPPVSFLGLPKYENPDVKANKSDFIDTEAIAKAVKRPTMRSMDKL
jgi:hypothetical protein